MRVWDCVGAFMLYFAAFNLFLFLFFFSLSLSLSLCLLGVNQKKEE